ncbi:MAG: von Willebrand factor type A domain protein [Promethearchaeota archaeon]|nr:MAG: von Willebrand factor type A domain protein [Candidatus Lokiarchaeota archaeon]
MENKIPEQVIICLDTSRSMFRRDYEQSRFNSSINAIKTLVSERLSSDNSRFGIVTFSNAARKVLDFTNSEPEILNALESLHIKGCSALGDALGLSIKMIIEELRKLVESMPKILIISDGNYTKTAIDPLKMARLAQGLNIKIDTFRLGEVSHLNILKRLTDLTNGTYYYINDLETLKESSIAFANSNVVPKSTTYKSPIENPSFLRKIAANLLRVRDLTKSMEQKLKQIRGVANYKKCSICFSDVDPHTKGSFYLTGRYCPNCQAPFHIHCLAGWADSQDDTLLKRSGTVRCPHCFYLLKIPTEVTQAQKLKILSGSRTVTSLDSKNIEEFTVDKIEAHRLGVQARYNACPVCNTIFEKDQDIIKCPKCETLYHYEECFPKLHDGTCRNCGSRLIYKK